ncbi:MAG TPA: hypothetical protein VG826_16305 [Pirellulales bacterium]|nr:hypothetical protein [Pirellulales bacterium]
MNAQRIAELMTDPAKFQAAVIIPSAHGKRRFGDVMADFQRERFALLNPALVALARGEMPAVGRYWWEATKGCSKDSDLAVCILWLLAFARRPLLCQVGAVDQDQAGELRKAAKDILALNPWLAELVEIQHWRIISKRKGQPERVCEIIAADVAGSHGARPDLLVINELTHISAGKKEFAETLMDNASKVPNGIVVIATNAGHVGTWQEEWQNLALSSDRWRVHIHDRPAPWIQEGELAEARKRNSANRYARLWGGQWVSQVGKGIPASDIDAAIKPNLKPTTKPRPGWVYVAGVDLATAHDLSAVVVIGKQVGSTYVVEKRTERQESRLTMAMRENGFLTEEPPVDEVVCRVRQTNRLRLAYCRLWAAAKGSKQKLSRVESALKQIDERLGLSACAYDPYEATLLAERLTEAGVPMVPVVFSAQNLVGMASAVLEEFANGNVQLYECDEGSKQLVADLRRMQIVEMSYGQRLAAKRSNGSHVDAGTAFAIAVLKSREFTQAEGDVLADDRDVILQ